MLLENELAELKRFIQHMDKHNSSVSASTVGWHIDHSLRVIIGIFNALRKSVPAEYKWRFNLAWIYVLSINAFPRGKAKAPDAIVARNTVTEDEIAKLLQEARKCLKEIVNLPTKSNFKHKYFGLLNLKQSKKLLKLHTNHHLKIINDIVKS